MKKLSFFLIIFLVKNIYAQNLLNENFNYGSTAGILCGSGGVTTNWTPFLNPGIDTVLYSTLNLVFGGYNAGVAGSGSGSLFLNNGLTTMESVNRPVASISSGNVYISFLLKFGSGGGANTNSEYFLFFNDTFGSSLTTNYIGRLFLQNVFLTPALKLGLSKGSGSSSAVFSSTNFTAANTYLVVMKYMFNTGSSTNDSVYAWYFPISVGVPPTEPSPQLVATDMTVPDIPRIRSVCIRQGSTTTNTVYIDGIHVGTSWSTSVFLPVTWIDVNAKLQKDNSVLLNWNTASEINNDYFEIEKSTDNSQWSMVGKVKGNRTTNSVSNYQFTDPINQSTPDSYLDQPINMFYRLKQVDFDGRFQYSKVVSVELNKMQSNDVIVYPNPSKNTFTISRFENEIGEVTIYSVTGMKIISFKQNLSEMVDISGLTAGIYYVEINVSSTKFYAKFVKE